MSRHGARRIAGIAAAAALFLAACNAITPTTPASDAISPAASAATSGPSTGTTSSAGPLAGQTDTDWGRIWDDVPEAFPIFPGATPADETATEAVSATFALEGDDPRAVATWMQTELERAAYRTEALNGPFEDGGFILDLTGADDCRIQISVSPLGGLTTVTVRYGAACPDP